MSMKDDIKGISKKVKALTVEQSTKTTVKKFKFPFKIKSKAKKAAKMNKILIVYFKANHQIEFVYKSIVNGMIDMDENLYKAFEDGAVYHYKKYAVVAVFEWRITPVGGVTETYLSRVIGGETDKVVAKDLGVGDSAQKILIRAIEKTEIEKDIGKPKKKFPIVLVVIGVGILIYVLGSAFGFI